MNKKGYPGSDGENGIPLANTNEERKASNLNIPNNMTARR